MKMILEISKHTITIQNKKFPLALALFTVIVYLGNDLMLPAMVQITQGFQVGAEWGPTSMSAYLLGGALLASIWGPVSDQLGRRKVFLFGAAFFIVGCVIILFTKSIEQFMLIRVLQGTALTLISAVGFATIQEAYEEKQAVKVMALMANISLLAPLAGPVLGAALIEYTSWEWGFVALAALAVVAFLGLFFHMPETVNLSVKQNHSVKSILGDFYHLYTNKRFMILALAGPLIGLPIMLWISLSPMFLMATLELSSYEYALSQLPVMGALVLGNLLLARLVDHYPLGKTVLATFPVVILGVGVMFLGLMYQVHLLVALIVGMSLIALAEGLSYAVLFRFALVASDISKGTVAAAMATVVMVFFSVIIEITKTLYFYWGFHGLVAVCALSIMAYAWLAIPVLKDVMAQRALEMENA